MDSNDGKSIINESMRKQMEGLFRWRDKFEEIYGFWKHLDALNALFTNLKEFNDGIQVFESGESDPLGILDRLKDLFCHRDRGAWPDLDSSTFHGKYCELIEKISQLDDMVNRVEIVLPRKQVRNLTKLLEDCQKNMHAFQVGLKEFQCIRALEKEIDVQKSIQEKVFQNSKIRAADDDKLVVDFEEEILGLNKYKRRYSL